MEDHADWYQLTQIRYKKDASGKIKIEPKDEMRKRGIESPDIADAFALTFAKSHSVKFYAPDVSTILSGGVKPFIPGIG